MAWYPASYPGTAAWRSGHVVPVFLLPFGRRPSLLGHPVPATEFGSPYGRLTGAHAPDLDGVSMFRTREMRLGKGVLYTPGTAVPTRPRMLHDRRLPHHSGVSLISPVLHPAREVMLTRHHQGFPVSRPVPSLPPTCDPRPERGPLGLSRELHTRPLPAAHVAAGTGHGH